MPAADTFWNQKHARARFVIVWLAFAWMRLVVWLPLRWQLGLGRLGGRLAGRLIRSRWRIVTKNLAACFPNLTTTERDALAGQHFEALGMSMIEMAMGWYGSKSKIQRHVRIEGLENLRAAQDRGKGVILLSAHFTTFEFFFASLAPECRRLCGMYRTQRNPVMNKIMTEGRERNFDHLFSNNSVRDMVRELSNNAVVWYASDQS